MQTDSDNTAARALCIVNPAAGRGRWRQVADQVKRIWREAGLCPEVIETNSPGEATVLAALAAKNGVERVLGVGGDGTLQEIVNGLFQVPAPPPLGIIPVGTGNDFVRSLGLPQNPLMAARLACSEIASSVDAAICNGRYYLNVAGVGFDAEVAHAVNERRRGRPGMFPYLWHTLIWLQRYKNQDLIIDLDGTRLQRQALLIAVGNGRYYAGGMMICPNASVTDGLLHVCIIGNLKRNERLLTLSRVFRGKHSLHPLVEFHRAATVRIEGVNDVRVHADGESVGRLPAVMEIVPSRLRVLGLRERKLTPVSPQSHVHDL